MSAQRPVVLLGLAHTCSIHGPGTVISGSPVCNLHGKPVARVGDKISCGATIITGSSTVLIDDGKAVARMGYTTDHGGMLIEGHSDLWRKRMCISVLSPRATVQTMRRNTWHLMWWSQAYRSA